MRFFYIVFIFCLKMLTAVVYESNINHVFLNLQKSYLVRYKFCLINFSLRGSYRNDEQI